MSDTFGIRIDSVNGDIELSEKSFDFLANFMGSLSQGIDIGGKSYLPTIQYWETESNKGHGDELVWVIEVEEETKLCSKIRTDMRDGYREKLAEMYKEE